MESTKKKWIEKKRRENPSLANATIALPKLKFDKVVLTCLENRLNKLIIIIFWH